MKKIILVSLAAFAFLTTNASASEVVYVNKYVNTETYPEGNTLENDLKKEKEYLKGIFDFDFDLDQSYELTQKKTYLYTEDSLVTKDGLDISFKYGPYSKDYEKASAHFKKSKIKGVDVLISRAGEFNGGKDSVFSADFKFDGLYYNLTIRGSSEGDFVKILENMITKILYDSPRGDASSENAMDLDFKGDSSYAEGMYLPEMSVVGKFYFKNGEAVNPYGASKVGKISKAEKEKILNDKRMKKLIGAYNRLYRVTINLYKYGENHMDRWMAVKNMTDPVFNNISKGKWVKIYKLATDSLSNVKYYFYSKGLDDADFTDQATLKAIGGDTRYVLALNKYKK
ncbi:hypothetical protein [uncultured Anaerococcus sp.]|uniref:hypothetical protein n=1 Tax=uncultured Anaerococcus sp. TaxID=293428 RepID=UPI00280B87CA|nr:hypothetical protein [uncultured Anaerococcus sp.]